MASVIKIDSVSAYNKLRQVKTLHPLISVIDASKATTLPAGSYSINLYCIFLKELKCGELKYGRGHYDYQEGTLVFLGPQQVVGVPENPGPSKGWALLFHPDLIKGTVLGRTIHQYSFFSYDINEALHISETERELVIDQINKIQQELERSIDTHTRKIIVSNIELLLSYFTRFYDRQFITRDQVNRGVIEQFEHLLMDYFQSGKSGAEGFPTVSYFAEQLRLSANYFGDLIKKETGQSPLEHIQNRVIDLAKEKMFDEERTVAEIGYELGFRYPQHFTRLFKQKVGMSPTEYRNLN